MKIKNKINSILYILGLKIIKLSKKDYGDKKFQNSQFKYEVIVPSSDYAPWTEDSKFYDIYEEIKNHTLVDIYRCYELWELTEKISLLNPQSSFIEVGVWRGGTAAIIGKKLSCLNSNVDFYLADTFSGVAKASNKDTYYSGGEHADTSIHIVERLLMDKYSNYKILKGIFPDETSSLIKNNNKFGFCHIDVDVYNSAKDIVDWIWPKLIIGGIIIFDDYGFHTCDGITRYVNEQKNSSDRIIIHNLNGHAIMIKLK